jgi:hypothetical protein
MALSTVLRRAVGLDFRLYTPGRGPTGSAARMLGHNAGLHLRDGRSSNLPGKSAILAPTKQSPHQQILQTAINHPA